MHHQPPSANVLSRRGLMRRGARLAYVVPAVLVAMRVEAAYAAPPKDKDKDKDKHKDKGSPFR